MEQKKWSTGGWKKQTAKGEVINFTINDVKYSMWVNAYKTEVNDDVKGGAKGGSKGRKKK